MSDWVRLPAVLQAGSARVLVLRQRSVERYVEGLVRRLVRWRVKPPNGSRATSSGFRLGPRKRSQFQLVALSGVAHMR